MTAPTILDRRRGRPLGDVSAAILTALSESPKTAHQLARELRCNTMAVRDKCRRLRESGQIEISARLRLPGVNKPVAQYAVADDLDNLESLSMLPDSFFETCHG